MALHDKGLTASKPLANKLVTSLGSALFSKYKDSDPSDLKAEYKNLLNIISKKIATNHNSVWSYLTFSSDELNVSDSSISDIKQWIRRFA